MKKPAVLDLVFRIRRSHRKFYGTVAVLPFVALGLSGVPAPPNVPPPDAPEEYAFVVATPAQHRAVVAYHPLLAQTKRLSENDVDAWLVLGRRWDDGLKTGALTDLPPVAGDDWVGADDGVRTQIVQGALKMLNVLLMHTRASVEPVKLAERTLIAFRVLERLRSWDVTAPAETGMTTRRALSLLKDRAGEFDAGQRTRILETLEKPRPTLSMVVAGSEAMLRQSADRLEDAEGVAVGDAFLKGLEKHARPGAKISIKHRTALRGMSREPILAAIITRALLQDKQTATALKRTIAAFK